MNAKKSLKSRALAILAQRETSRWDLQRKLLPHAADADEVERVLDDLAAAGWQSDARFAEMWVSGKSRKHGRLRLQQALAARGVERDTINACLPDRETEQAHAQAVLRKKFRQPAADAAEAAKQMRFLCYRGFDADTARAAMRQAWEVDGDD